MISVRGLRKSYADGARGRVPVLDGLDLDVANGDFVAVVGRSGSGKSTLLHILGGLDRDYEGAVVVAGARLDGLGERALARFRNERVGVVFQAFHLVEGLDVVENVALPACFGSEAWAGARQRAHEALERVGLGDKAQRHPSQLSGGERQRVAVARALFSRPPLLLCDEPTGNLDAETATQVVALFQALNRDGLTVVAVTHEERLRAAARRIVVLAQGRVS